MDKVILIYPQLGGRREAALLPLSLIYLAAFLVARFNVRIIDQRVDREWRRTLERELGAGACVCVGISTMTGPQIGAALEAATLVRSLAPTLPIVWGGVHPSLLPEETLRHELVDIVVIGDGEETFAELVATLHAGGDLHAVRGIMFKEGANVVNPGRRPPFTLQRIPESAFALVDLDRYHLPALITQGRCLPIVTSRGCPFHCGFCYNARFHGRRWSALSAEQTVSWIAGLRARFGITDLFLLDDNFFVDLERVAAICRLLAEEGFALGIHNANCRIDTLLEMNDDFLALLQRTGFNRLFVGVESGSDGVLRRINKGITVEQVLMANRKLGRARIHPCYSFMTGFPGETVDDVKKTLFLMNRLRVENSAAVVYPLQFYTPFPGTDLAQEAKACRLPFPASLTEWTGYHYDHLLFPVGNLAHARFLNDIHFYSRYLDDKLAAAHAWWRRPMMRLYSWMLRGRIQRGWYGCRLELRLLQWVRGAMGKMGTNTLRP